MGFGNARWDSSHCFSQNGRVAQLVRAHGTAMYCEGRRSESCLFPKPLVSSADDVCVANRRRPGNCYVATSRTAIED